jgi:hypothetical protein
MIGFGKSLQTVLLVLMIILSLSLIALQVARYSKASKFIGPLSAAENRQKEIDKILWICEFLTVLSLIGVVVTNFVSYYSYIPENSPGCLKYISPFGVIASGVDPSTFAVKPAATYLANSYQQAVDKYRTSPNGLATGYFAWDGLQVTILNSDAAQLATGATPGTSWVFQDLHTAVARS